MKYSLKKNFVFFIFFISLFEDSTCFHNQLFKPIHFNRNHNQINQDRFENAEIIKTQNQLILKLSDRVVSLLNVPDVRQSTTYTCGPASLLAVFSYYKTNEDLRQMQIAKMANTNQLNGTSPQNLQKTIRNLGLGVQIKENMKLQDLQLSILNKQPVIIAFQAWPEKQINYQNDWDDGHYAVAIGYDQESIFFEDPSLIGSIGYIQKNQFLKRWHDVDGQFRKFFNMEIIIKSNHQYKPVIKKLQ